MKNEIKPDMAQEKVRFLEQNLHSEVIGDFSPYFSGVAVDFKDFTAVPGFLKSINQNDTQQFGVVFSIPEKERLEYYNCFNDFRYSWGHTVHAERLTVIKTPLSQITDEDAIEVAKIILGDPFGRYRNIEVIRNFAITGFPYISIQHKQLKHRLQIDCTLVNFNVIEMGEDVSSQIDMKPCDCVDYLRSKGYALPFMGRSVEQMVELGWIKLKGDSNHG